MKSITTKIGNSIPYVGLGTFPFQERQMADIIKQAVKEGYRLFDTSDDYRGETGIGMAVNELISEGDYKREDLFLQTKISDNNAYGDEPLVGIFFNPNHPFMQRHSVEDIVREKVECSLRKLGTTYLDSLLIHYPFPEYYVDIWKTMIKLRDEGLIRYIGVSNFHVRHLEKLKEETGVMPDVNEIYLSPISTKEDVVNYCIKNDCVPMAYSPLIDIPAHRLDEGVLSTIANKYGKTLAQTVLRWNIQRGCIPLPKTKNSVRLKENIDVFGFQLAEDDMNTISCMNKNFQYLIESKICPGL